VNTSPVDLLDRVRAHCRRHDLLPARAGVLALVSGGADSMCLMHVLAAIHDGPMHVMAIDHGFRDAAADEVAGVLRAARALGLPAHGEALDLAPGGGAAERARDARLAAAERARVRLGLDLVATGHTRTDHVETVLFRAARGTGRSGALGIAPRRDRLVRPLLGVSRADTRAWCRAAGVAFVDDPTNHDMTTARARVRHGVLPALEAVHPGAEHHVAQLADLLRDEAQVIDDVVDAARHRVRRDGGLDAAALGREHAAVARLLVRRLLVDAGLRADALAGDVVEAVRARAAAGRGVTQVPGGIVAVDHGVLLAEAHGAAIAAVVPAPLGVPGRVRLADDRVVRASRGAAARTTPVDAWVRASGRLVVRPPAPGDRIALAGGGHQSVGRLLQAAGVPARRRPAVAVVASGDRVLWVAGHRACAESVAAPGEDAVHLSVGAA
jgi:tRNA(Ile)-lysidine synthase